MLQYIPILHQLHQEHTVGLLLQTKWHDLQIFLPALYPGLGPSSFGMSWAVTSVVEARFLAVLNTRIDSKYSKEWLVIKHGPINQVFGI